MRTITRLQGRYSASEWLQDYVDFMTTPGSHNDTYAESFHRDFFANYAQGAPPAECSKGTEGHNTAQIGGFVVRTFVRCIHPKHAGAKSNIVPSAAMNCLL